MKYLVKTHSGIGEVAIEFGLYNAIFRLDPECHIEVLASSSPAHNLFNDSPFIKQIHVRPSSFFADLMLQASLLQKFWDVVLITRGGGHLQIFLRLTKAKFKRCRWYTQRNQMARRQTIRAKNENGRWYTEVPDGEHEMQIRLSMLNGILPGWEEPVDPKIRFNSRRTEEVANKLGLMEHDKLMTIQPGGSFFEKMWDKEKFVALIKEVSGFFDRTLILGSDSEHELCEFVANNTGSSNLAGSLELLDICALMELVSLHVGNDSSIGHLAAAAGTATLAIGDQCGFRYAPWNQHMILGDAKKISLEEVLVYLHKNILG